MKKKMILPILVSIALVGISFQANSSITFSEPEINCKSHEKMLGIDANYVNQMKESIYRWRKGLTPINVYSFFKENGINYHRLRIFVKDEGPDSLQYAINTAKIVQDVGMKCSITLFLSSDWSDIGKQPAPEPWVEQYDWFNLTENQQCSIIRNYTKNITKDLLSNGIDADLYEIGNEIDYGICGIYEDNLVDRENIPWMENTIWRQMAAFIQAGIEGVQSVDETSAFILHITHWWDYNFSSAFFTTMEKEGIRFDYMGLSFYPSSGIYNITKALMGEGNGTLSQQLFFDTTLNLSQNLGKQIIISEYAYPSSSLIIGPFSSFNREVQGYPLTKQGQKGWLRDFLRWTDEQPCIAGSFYFSPEFYVFIWAPMSLFTYFGKVKPAIDAFDQFSS